MKRVLVSLVLVVVLVLTPIAGIMAANPDPTPARADTLTPVAEQPIINCSQTRINNKQIRIRCSAAGIQLLNTVVDLPVINVTGPTITVKLPGQDETVRVPGPTRTVTVPGNTPAPKTVTIEPPPDTRTVEVPGPTVSDTETVIVSPSENGGGQGGSDGDTLDPGDDQPVIDIDLSGPQVVGYGTLVTIGLAALILLGMYGGYYMGYKDSQKNEARFLRSLLK